jgi:hypothetical protein
MVDMLDEVARSIDRTFEQADKAADRLSKIANSDIVDGQFLNSHIASLAAGQAMILAQMISICRLMACLRDGVSLESQADSKS